MELHRRPSGGVDTCTFFVPSPDPLNDEEGCKAEDGTGNRCMGCEQVEFGFDDAYPGAKVKKVQWRHSCETRDQVDERDCTHLMLNVDMAVSPKSCTSIAGADPPCR